MGEKQLPARSQRSRSAKQSSRPFSSVKERNSLGRLVSSVPTCHTLPAGHDDYIRPVVKIESGAKSALDLPDDITIVPYGISPYTLQALQAKNIADKGSAVT